MKKFKLSKVEKDSFKYLGCEYIQNIKEVNVPAKRNSCRTNDEEKKEIRRVVGELLWASLMTQPDLSFEVNLLSTNISNATIRDLKDARRLVEKAKFDPIAVNVTRIGRKEDIRIKLYCDASFCIQEDKVKSTEG